MSKDALRQQMPTVAEIVDELRPWLGRVIFAQENGHTLDRREPVSPDQVFDIPPNYRKDIKPKESANGKR